MRGSMQEVPLTVGSIVRHGTGWHGDAVVITATADGTRRASLREVGERAARLAGALRRLGIHGDDRVATFAWNNQEHLEAYLAVPAMGAVLHTLNVRLFPEQIAWIANHAEDRVLIVDAGALPLLAPVLVQMDTVHTILVAGEADPTPLAPAGRLVLSYADLLAEQPTEFDWPEVAEDAAAAMCYTSGTTGDPKGVVYSHRSMYLHSTAVCSGNALAVSAADRLLPIVPMFHANAWGLPYAALMAGADLLLPDRFLTADRLVDLIEEERPTVAAAVPTIWNDILQHLRLSGPRDLSSLRQVACGGSAVPRTLMQAFQEEFGVYIEQAWGMTETSPLATVSRPPRGVSDQEAWDYRATQGRPLCGVQVRLVDDGGQVLPVDGKAVGEVEVRGPWVTAAYYRDPDPDRFDEGWLRTGDVGLIDPRGYVTLTDRAKDVIKSGGEWISSVELETTLAGHPEVVEAAVIGVPDERWQERPLACVVLTEGASVTPQGLLDWLVERVPRWWLPERWSVVQAVPRTSVGKFDKKTLRRSFADGQLPVQQVPAPDR